MSIAHESDRSLRIGIRQNVELKADPFKATFTEIKPAVDYVKHIGVPGMREAVAQVSGNVRKEFMNWSTGEMKHALEGWQVGGTVKVGPFHAAYRFNLSEYVEEILNS